MQNIKEIILEIESMFESEQWERCISHCKKAMPLTNLLKLDEWFRIRFILSKCLIMDNAGHPNYVKQSIGILLEILQQISKDDNPERWAIVNLSLGFAYDEMDEDERMRNIDIILNYYNSALSVFTKKEYTEEWAATMAAVGYLHAIHETGDVSENITKGMKYILEALQYYTKKDHPCQYWDKLKELKRLRNLLRNDNLWFKVVSGFDGWEEIRNDINGTIMGTPM